MLHIMTVTIMLNSITVTEAVKVEESLPKASSFTQPMRPAGSKRALRRAQEPSSLAPHGIGTDR